MLQEISSIEPKVRSIEIIISDYKGNVKESSSILQGSIGEVTVPP